jgi:protein maelstrom
MGTRVSKSAKSCCCIKTPPLLQTSPNPTDPSGGQPQFKNISLFGIFTCLFTLILALMFKDYLINLLIYLEKQSTTNLVEFHILLTLLFICVSLPILWGYTICILACAYIYSFQNGLLLVIANSTIGMTVSYFICRYAFYDYAHSKVMNVEYLQVLFSLIQSDDKGAKIIFLSRLMPVPFGLANTIYAITDVKFKKYLIISILGLMPTQLILCYIGSTLKSMSDVLVNESTARTASLVFVVQLIIAIGVMYYILQAARIEIKKHMKSGASDVVSAAECGVAIKCKYCNMSQLDLNVDCEHHQLLAVTNVYDDHGSSN